MGDGSDYKDCCAGIGISGISINIGISCCRPSASRPSLQQRKGNKATSLADELVQKAAVQQDESQQNWLQLMMKELWSTFGLTVKHGFEVNITWQQLAPFCSSILLYAWWKDQ